MLVASIGFWIGLYSIAKYVLAESEAKLRRLLGFSFFYKNDGEDHSLEKSPSKVDWG
jgi:hypothetical protein